MNCEECHAQIPEQLRLEADYCRAVWRGLQGGVFVDSGMIRNARRDAATIHRLLGLDPQATGCPLVDNSTRECYTVSQTDVGRSERRL